MPWEVRSYTEDQTHQSGDHGVFILGVRRDTPASQASASGDYTGFIVDAEGRLYVSSKATEDRTSVLYNGGGTSNALQTAVTWTAFNALGTKPTVIDASNQNAIDVWLMNTTASQGGTLVIMETSADPATAATVTRITEGIISAVDQTFDADQNAWGLAAGTNKAAKEPMRITIRPTAYISLFMSASDGGVWYARYALHGDA